jgi:hypothetical protein
VPCNCPSLLLWWVCGGTLVQEVVCIVGADSGEIHVQSALVYGRLRDTLVMGAGMYIVLHYMYLMMCPWIQCNSPALILWVSSLQCSVTSPDFDTPKSITLFTGLQMLSRHASVTKTRVTYINDSFTSHTNKGDIVTEQKYYLRHLHNELVTSADRGGQNTS